MILFATGHRPNKLGGYNNGEAEYIRKELAAKYLEILQPEVCIVGGALGWDTDVAIACIELSVPFILAMPFKGQESVWPKASQEIYNFIKEKAKNTVIVSEGGFSPQKMQIRNEWMVDNSDQGLSLYDGTSGGTHNCIKYALQKNKKVTNLWEEFKKISKVK